MQSCQKIRSGGGTLHFANPPPSWTNTDWARQLKRGRERYCGAIHAIKLHGACTDDLVELASGFQGLNEICLVGDNTRLTDTGIQSLGQRNSLRAVTIRGPIDRSVFEKLPELATLESLELREFAIDNDRSETILSLKTLRALKLVNCTLTAETAEILFRCSQLDRLELNRCDLPLKQLRPSSFSGQLVIVD